MADEKSAKKRIIKKHETVRERAEKAGNAAPKKRVLRKTASSAARPFRAINSARDVNKYVKIPDNRFWRFMAKPRKIVPSFIRNAFKELRLVSWPNRRETIRLTTAVFVFAVTFGVVISITDYALDKIFRNFILK